MNFIHLSSLLHRDLKPDNLLMVSLDHREYVCCKITDMGCMRGFSKAKATQYYTTGIGTPAYMAPEVLSSEKYSPAADVYSFGVIVFQVFAGSEIFEGDEFKTSWKICEYIVNGKRPAIPARVPTEIQNLISSCWAGDPHARPNFSEIVPVLTQYLKKQKHHHGKHQGHHTRASRNN
eukprot:TRINITY_DN9376_c0_g1_i1.p1 TRINITY_DN9376_c0_g1~~TRINITY_DN9376_c0_g1_i1.p1  ORF type:complete len:190 (-),score=47.14 TRINITY_DN9376_c0_g1_i1:38-568(-)